METLKSSKAVAVVTTVLFVGSVMWLMNTKSVNSSLEAGMKEQQLRSEALLSEKLLLEKDMEKFKDQLAKLRGENASLDDLAKKAMARLKEQESGYDRMKRENASLAQVRKQRQELEALKNQLQNELTSLRASYAALEAKNNELNNTIVALQERNKTLTDDLNRAMFATVDQTQIQAVKGKAEKLTVKARRTKKLIASLEVPANLKNLSFRIADSNGNVLKPEQGTLAFTAVPSDNNITASSDPGVEGNKLQRVELVYLPKQKLKTGVYTVEVLNENLYVGSLKVRLN